MQTDLALWIFTLAAVLVYALAVAAEFAFPAARGTVIRAQGTAPTDEPGRGAAADYKPVILDPVQFLTAMLVLKTTALIVLTLAVARLLPDSWGVWEYMGVGALLVLAVLVGNAALRNWVVARAVAVATRLTGVVRVAVQVVTPISLLLRAVGRRNQPDEDVAVPDDVLLSEDGLRLLMGMGDEENAILESEKEMIASILEMDDTAAREVMVPRMDMVTLADDATLIEALDVILEAGHSRIPVYENNVDQIVGILYAKDLLRCYRENRADEAIRNLLRPAYFVPLSKKVNVLLRDMQKHRVHIAMVVDEYGGIAGLVTIEDILEEIVGDIQDEYDQGEDSYVQMLGPDSYLFNSRLDLYSVAKLLDVELDDEDADTLGGMIYSLLGHVPVQGESVEIAEWVFTVLSVDGNRIDQIRADRKVVEVESTEDEPAEADTADPETADPEMADSQADADTKPGNPGEENVPKAKQDSEPLPATTPVHVASNGVYSSGKRAADAANTGTEKSSAE